MLGTPDVPGLGRRPGQPSYLPSQGAKPRDQFIPATLLPYHQKLTGDAQGAVGANQNPEEQDPEKWIFDLYLILKSDS